MMLGLWRLGGSVWSFGGAAALEAASFSASSQLVRRELELHVLYVPVAGQFPVRR